jgi:hypothetical protein
VLGINRWRISWIRFLFYFTFVFIFTWPFLFFTTKYYSVFTTHWAFSWDVAPPHAGAPPQKRYACVTEQEWFNAHMAMIKGLAFDKYQGDATNLPQDAGRSQDRGRSPSTGNEHVDTAVSVIQGGLSVWNSVQRARGRDVDGWGGDS